MILVPCEFRENQNENHQILIEILFEIEILCLFGKP